MHHVSDWKGRIDLLRFVYFFRVSLDWRQWLLLLQVITLEGGVRSLCDFQVNFSECSKLFDSLNNDTVDSNCFGEPVFGRILGDFTFSLCCCKYRVSSSQDFWRKLVDETFVKVFLFILRKS